MIEYRAFGSFTLRERNLQGRVITYNEIAPTVNELVKQGAFRFRKNVTLNVMHRPLQVLAWTANDSLTLKRSAAGIELRSELPHIPAADLAIDQIKRKTLNGLSVEMIVERETRNTAGTRIIEQAELVGVGLVDVPAYPSSTLELRRRSGTSTRSSIRKDVPAACECSGLNCSYAEFTDNALDTLVDSFNEKDEILAAYNNFSEPLASKTTNSVRVAKTSSGVTVTIDLPDSDSGMKVLDAIENSGVVVRPFLDRTLSTGTERPLSEGRNVMVYDKAVLRGFIISATDQSEGWEQPELINTPQENRSKIARPKDIYQWL